MPNGTEAKVVHINESLKADYHFATNVTHEWPTINHQTRSKLIHLVWCYTNVWGFRHHDRYGSNENDLRGK